jgi:acyl dehydratase
LTTERTGALADMPVGYEVNFEHTFPMVVALFHAYALGQFHPWFLEDSPYGGPVVGLTMLGSYLRSNRREGGGPVPYQGGRTMQVGYETEWHRPPRVGEPLDVRIRCANKYRRGDKDYLDLESSFRDQSGALLVRHVDTSLLKYDLDALPYYPVQPGENGGAATAAVAGTRSPADPAAAVATRDALSAAALDRLEVGAEIGPRRHPVSLARQGRFSEWWRSAALNNGVFAPLPLEGNRHTDHAFARANGFPGAIVSSPLYVGWMASWLFELFGSGFLEGGRLRLEAIALMAPGQDLALRLRVTDRQSTEAGTRLTLDAHVEDAAGQTIAAGEAAANVPVVGG